MCLSTEVAGRRTIGRRQIPLDDGELGVSAFNHKPANRVIAGDSANLALEFFQTRHAFSVKAETQKNVSIAGIPGIPKAGKRAKRLDKLLGAGRSPSAISRDTFPDNFR